jgi:hypothetical protein
MICISGTTSQISQPDYHNPGALTTNSTQVQPITATKRSLLQLVTPTIHGPPGGVTREAAPLEQTLATADHAPRGSASLFLRMAGTMRRSRSVTRLSSGFAYGARWFYVVAFLPQLWDSFALPVIFMTICYYCVT